FCQISGALIDAQLQVVTCAPELFFSPHLGSDVMAEDGKHGVVSEIELRYGGTHGKLTPVLAQSDEWLCHAQMSAVRIGEAVTTGALASTEPIWNQNVERLSQRLFRWISESPFSSLVVQGDSIVCIRGNDSIR